MITLSKTGFPSITIRSPEFGNTEKLEIGRINRKTRGGDLKIFRRDIWPVTNIFSYQFVALQRSEALGLLNFIQTTNGTLVTLLDYEQRSWNGFIINPDIPISEVGPNCQYTAGFDFEWINFN